MVIPRAVIDHGFFLDAFLRCREINLDGAIFQRRRRKGGNLQSVQAFPCVPVTQLGKKRGGIRRNPHTHPAQTTIHIAKCAFDQNQKIAFRQRPKLKNLRAGNQRAVDAEKWILRRRPNEPHHAILDFWQ